MRAVRRRWTITMCTITQCTFCITPSTDVAHFHFFVDRFNLFKPFVDLVKIARE
jgi:hypothetical protein